jgi:hypothetical protein
MKSLIKALSFAAVFGFLATSCETDPCKDVETGEHGTCLEGIVTCDPGYEKDANNLCNLEQRAKFVDNWTVTEDCSASTPASYPVTIINSTAGITEVKISNFWNLFVAATTATIEGNNITISRQEPDGDGYFIQGNGTINGNTITMTYTVTNETDPQNITSDVCTNSIWVK